MVRTILLSIVALTILSAIFCEDIRKKILNDFMDKPTKELFKVYHFLHSKSYNLDSGEAIKRYRNFKDNLNYIKQRNAENLSFKLGLNQFSDITNEEYRSLLIPSNEFNAQEEQMLRFLSENRNYYVDFDTMADQDNEDMKSPWGVDWSNRLVKAKDQGKCGASWAFAVTAALEGNYNIKKNSTSDALVSFSEQQLVDCGTGKPNGCAAGWWNNLFNYTKLNGIQSENSYPFTSGASGNSGTCQYNSNAATIKNTGYRYCTRNKNLGEKTGPCNWAAFMTNAKKGPFITTVDASSPDFQHYSEGIWQPTDKDCTAANQAITAVGYDRDQATWTSYVILRNSFSTSWGENGYIRVKYSQNTKNTCFITETMFQPDF